MKKEVIYAEILKSIDNKNWSNIEKLLLNYDKDYVSPAYPLILSYAIYNKLYTVFESLLSNGFNPVLTGSDGLQVIHEIAINGDTKGFQILKSFRRDVLKQDFSVSPIMLAAIKHHTDLVRVFSEEGNDIDLWVNNLLYISCLRGEYDNAKYFIEHGGNVNYVQDGVSVLSASISSQNANLIRLIEDKGAFDFEIEQLDYMTQKTWFDIIGSEDKDIILHYMAKGCTKDMQNNSGETALLVAKQKKYKTFLDLIKL